MTIVYRSDQALPLTWEQLDGNFADLAARTNTAWAMDGLEPDVRSGAGNPAELTPFKAGIVAYAYGPSAMSESFANWDVPFSWAVGTDLYLAFHWSPGNSTAVGVVRWGIEYIWADVNGVFGDAVTEYYDCATDGTAYKHFQNVSTPFPGGLAAPNMRFLMRIFRDGASVNDTFSADAFLIGVDFYYQVNKFGTYSFTPPYTEPPAATLTTRDGSPLVDRAASYIEVRT